MRKNVASQKIGIQMASASDGSAFTGTVTVYVTGDAGSQALGSVGSGVCTHEGNGYHTYAPAQAETNYDLIGFTFIGSGAIPSTVQIFTGFPQTVDNATGIADIPTVAEFNARTLAAASYFDPAADAVANVTLVATTTTNTDMRGTDSAATATALATAQTDLDTITGSDGATLATAQTLYAPNKVVPDAAGVAPTAVEIRQEMDGNSVDFNTIITTLGTAGAGLTDLGGMSTDMKTEVLAEVVKVLVTQMTESYAADGTAPTMTQALMLIQQALTEFAISGTTQTYKKLDGSTTAATGTLDDGTNPTSITRAS